MTGLFSDELNYEAKWKFPVWFKKKITSTAEIMWESYVTICDFTNILRSQKHKK